MIYDPIRWPPAEPSDLALIMVMVIDITIIFLSYLFIKEVDKVKKERQAYMRDYMRKYREKKKNELPTCPYCGKRCSRIKEAEYEENRDTGRDKEAGSSD